MQVSPRARALAAALEPVLGVPLSPKLLARTLAAPGAGGCINQTALLPAASGREALFLKWNERPLPGQFAAEAAGLQALAEGEGGLVIPRPLAWSDRPGEQFLALEYLPPGSPQADFEEALGRGLAELHLTSQARGFGFPCEGYCGATPQPNGWLPTWVEFYRERRLRHQLRLAAAKGLGSDTVRRGERLLGRLEGLLGDPEPPALIHGDLWSGNLHVSPTGSPALIDPAAYWGHREAELGMMVLFGGFSERVFAAYEARRPLQPGWRERLELYTLYHVLNHFNLFGGGYGAQAARLIARWI